MSRLARLALPLALITSPAVAADLDRPHYNEPEHYYHRPPPRVVERERIIEHHHHYVPAPPVHVERRVYIEPRIYRHYSEHRPHYAEFGWRPRRFFRPWHHYHHHHRHW